MNVMELGAIGELVGGVAVLATLIYLAVQIRQGNRLEKAESVRATTRDYVSTMLAADALLLRRAFVDFGNMSKEDQLSAHTWLIAFFSVAETEIMLSAQDLTTIASYPPVVASMTRMPGLQRWWGIVEPTFGGEFRTYVRQTVEAQVTQNEPAPHEFMPWLSPDALAEA